MTRSYPLTKQDMTNFDGYGFGKCGYVWFRLSLKTLPPTFGYCDFFVAWIHYPSLIRPKQEIQTGNSK